MIKQDLSVIVDQSFMCLQSMNFETCSETLVSQHALSEINSEITIKCRLCVQRFHKQFIQTLIFYADVDQNDTV